MELSRRQDEIIKKSINIISVKGIQGLTIKNLSKEIGISEPAIYRHFENKFEILKTMLLLFKDESEETFKIAETFSENSIEQLKIFLSEKIKKFEENPSLASVIFAEDLFKHEEELKNLVFHIIETNTKKLQEIIEKGQRKNQIRDDIPSETLSLIILGSFRLLVKRWTHSNTGFSIKKEGEKLKSSIIKLIRKEKK